MCCKKCMGDVSTVYPPPFHSWLNLQNVQNKYLQDPSCDAEATYLRPQTWVISLSRSSFNVLLKDCCLSEQNICSHHLEWSASPTGKNEDFPHRGAGGKLTIKRIYIPPGRTYPKQLQENSSMSQSLIYQSNFFSLYLFGICLQQQEMFRQHRPQRSKYFHYANFAFPFNG